MKFGQKMPQIPLFRKKFQKKIPKNFNKATSAKNWFENADEGGRPMDSWGTQGHSDKVSRGSID